MSNQAIIEDIENSDINQKGDHKRWKEEPLGKNCEIITGKNFSSDKYVESGIPLIRISNLGNGTISKEDLVRLPDDELENLDRKYILQRGDTLIALSGATTGKLGVIRKEDSPSILNQRIGKFRPEENLNKIFLRFVVESHEYQRYVNAHAKGGAQPNISASDLKNINIPRPPLYEQNRIASILYNVDQAIQKTEEIIEQTQKVKKGLMQDMILKGVNQVGEIQELEDSPVEDRKLVKLGDVMSLEYGENLPEDDRNKGKVLVYGSNGPVDYHDEADVEKEGIVIGRKGTIGGAVYSDEPFWPIDTTYYITEDETDLNLKFLYYLINSLQLGRLNAASAIPGLNRNDAYGLKALVPDKDTQTDIVVRLEAIDDLVKKKETEKKHLQLVKKGLMQDLLTGKVRTDEDVEVLEEVVEYE